MSQFKPTAFTTRTGRIVWAGGDRNSLYEPKTKDYDGNAMVIKEGADKGKPTQRYEFGLAIAKQPGETHWGQTPEGALIWAQGHADHPHSASRPDFAWKVVDGDSQIPGKGRNGKPGKKPCEKEGYPGHWVFTFSSSYAIKFLNANGSAYLPDVGAVKVGDYVQVAGNVVGNTGASPGVYLNHNFVALQGYGDPITSGPDPSTLGFGGGAAPAGMKAVPPGAMTAPPVTAQPPAPATPAPPALPSALPPPVAAPSPLPPPVVVAPNPAILAPAAPPAPAAPQMTAAATATYAAYQAAGWSDAQLRAGGLML